MFKVLINNSKSFISSGESSILEDSIKNNIHIPYNCKDGRCNSCKATVSSGKFYEKKIGTNKIDNTDFILTCKTFAKSDISIKIEDLSEFEIPKSVTVVTKLKSVKKYDEYYAKVSLILHPKSNFKYLPGQYIDIIFQEKKRSYSVSHYDTKNKVLEFYIKYYENGFMSNLFFNEMKINQILRVKGPNGTFFYRESKKQNIIFMATGTGIGPVKNILENLHNKNDNLNNKLFWLFWGMRGESDFFWKPELPNLNYFPTISRKENDKKNYIQDVMLTKNIDLNNSSVYACGSENMINDLISVLKDENFDLNYFYSDVFLTSN